MRYSQLIENINDVLYKVDADGTISYVSSPVISILGYTRDELVGQHFLNFIHLDDRDEILRVFNDSHQGGISSTECRFQAKCGDFIWLRSSGRPVYDEDRPVGLYGVLSDISERKKTEKVLQERKVTIETATKVFDSDYCAAHAGFVPGEFVLLAVSDNGCSMDKGILVERR